MHVDRVGGGLGAVQPATSVTRMLITLLLDTSDSMRSSGGIQQLNDALSGLGTALAGNPSVALSGEIAVITFGRDGVQVRNPAGTQQFDPRRPFVPVRRFNPPRLEAGGVTPMTEAIRTGLRVLSDYKSELRQNGISMAHRPLMFVVTDGYPTDASGNLSDDYRSLLPALREREQLKQLLFYAIGVDNANERILTELAPARGQHYKLAGLDFASVIQLVSTSVQEATKLADQPAGVIYEQTNELKQQMDAFLRGN
jgi:uncharacterized protein YegL